MKRVSWYLLPVLLSLILGSSRPIPKTHTGKGFDTYYYWYSTSTDSYGGYSDVTDEILTLEEEYGVLVNTSPAGGTEIEAGYTNNNDPHTVWPSVILYTH